MGGGGAIPMNPELLSLAENGDSKAVDLMMDWAHGPAGHFGGHCCSRITSYKYWRNYCYKWFS